MFSRDWGEGQQWRRVRDREEGVWSRGEALRRICTERAGRVEGVSRMGLRYRTLLFGGGRAALDSEQLEAEPGP